MNRYTRAALAALFLVAVGLYVDYQYGSLPDISMLVFAAVVGGYMALNIGANDVANNMGPAVGSFALTMGAAIAIAAIFEASGALIAGGDVVKTVKKGIIDPLILGDGRVYVWVMVAALMGGALWLNIATALSAPVSTTHSIVGGVMGAAIAAAGWTAVNWSSMAAIAASWVISPVMGGVIAAALLMLLQRQVYERDDVIRAAQRVVPALTAVMVMAFSAYLVLKGLKHLIKVEFGVALMVGAILAVPAFLGARAWLRGRVDEIGTSREQINRMFTIPLVAGAALLSFAHGANDVANAVGPLAGVFDALQHGGPAAVAAIPKWVMVVGAVGLSLGLALYGPRLIKTVGSEITELDRARAFCIALSAAVTVLIASQLGLPVSSTHVALGAVFGVGFLREYLDGQASRAIEAILNDPEHQNNHFVLEQRLHKIYDASPDEKKAVMKEIKGMKGAGMLSKAESKRLRKVMKRALVKRQLFTRIVSAWLITVPASAAMSAAFYFMLRGALLP